MSPALISILIQLVSGGAGGGVLNAVFKKLPLSKMLGLVLGAVGGVGGGQLASVIPLLQGLLESAGSVGGQAGAAATGGAVLTLIVGLIKKAMAGKSSAE